MPRGPPSWRPGSTVRLPASTVRALRSSARSGVWSTAGGRRTPSTAATSRSSSRPARTPSSSAMRNRAAGSASAASDPGREPAVGRVQVEEPRRSVHAADPVHDADRSGDERPGLGAQLLALREEDGLALEHEERVDVVVVMMEVDAAPGRLDGELEQGHLGPFRADRDRARGGGHLRAHALTVCGDDRGSGTAGLLDVVDVEVGRVRLLARYRRAQIAAEPSGRVDVEEASALALRG